MGFCTRVLLFGLLVLAGTPARAEIVHLTLPSKLVAQGEFRPGDPAKPAVLLLHGFLQTQNFPTIHRLVEALSDEGYTVLAPTLSLGIPHRSQSVACEAIHTHTVAQGAEEIDAWVKWLTTKSPGKVVLAGHSIGNIYNLAYLASYPSARVVKLIGISIVEGRLKIGEPARAGLVRDLRKVAQVDKRKPVEHQFSFCQRFNATRESLLSYLEWGPDKILTAVRKTRLPITMIMGSKDDRLGTDWLDRLKKTPAKVIIIPGANHFMDGQHEFDLVDEFLHEIKST
jgi:pimeloyl-ACP methyl ester carboxylesterase